MRALLAILVAGTAAAQFPKLDRVLPRGGQRGTTVEVTLVGTHLATARDLLISPGGVSVEALEPDGNSKLRARLVLAPDAELGPRAVWVRFSF